MDHILNISLADLQTESDVEQKFITPILTSRKPLGLNYLLSDFSTKKALKKLLIGKGEKAQLYYPDYAIINSGLPLLIIEAKKPGEPLDDAFHEARLYANELNAMFPHKVNPCNTIIASNGYLTIYGTADSDELKGEFSFDDISSANANFGGFLDYCCKDKILKEADIVLKIIRGPSKYIRPISLIGGKSAQNEELKPNTFGSTISLEFRSLFNPESLDEKNSIVHNAYVTTRRLLRHLYPIESIIRSSQPLFASDALLVEDTKTPVEITSKFKEKKNLRNQLLLLIGGVGAGKSTFTQYLREEALGEELTKNTVWVNINMNYAPLERVEIYNWLKRQLIEGLETVHPDLDFELAAVLLKIFAVEFHKLEKGAASFYVKNSEKYQELFANKMAELLDNVDTKAKAYVRYLCGERDKLLVVVLDNCDKRSLEDQLLMFDVASWLKEEFSCLVFLPLRDTTYDNFKKEKPLDTVIKDLVFRIDPPLLREIIYKRIHYALRLLSKGRNTLSFQLDNGIKVDYPASEQGFFLASIARSLFENIFFNQIVAGLSGKNIRKGLEIFLDFCKSGHINEGELLKIQQTKGIYKLPHHLIARVLLKGNRKYYSDTASNIKNLFASFPEEDILPNPFCRVSILKWLEIRKNQEGPNKTKGYHRIDTMLHDLTRFGYNENRVINDLNNLIRFGCIVPESQKATSISYDELISITPSGLIHIQLVGDINYLSACSEDFYFRENQIASTIKNNITVGNVGFVPQSKRVVFENSLLLLQYLISYKKTYLYNYNNTSFIADNDQNDIDLEYIYSTISKFDYKEEDVDTLLDKYTPGTHVDCEIVSIQDYGLFINFGLKLSGLIHVSWIEKKKMHLEDFDIGQPIYATIINYSPEHKRFLLKI